VLVLHGVPAVDGGVVAAAEDEASGLGEAATGEAGGAGGRLVQGNLLVRAQVEQTRRFVLGTSGERKTRRVELQPKSSFVIKICELCSYFSSFFSFSFRQDF